MRKKLFSILFFLAMIFGKNDGQTVVRQMTKNSKKVASDSIMNDVMGMFMFEKKVTG